MYDKILVPMALDHGISEQTLAVAKALAGDAGEVIAMHVYEAPQGSVAAYLSEDAMREGLERAQAELDLRTKTLDGVTAVLVKGHTYRSIIDYSAENSIDCIVIGSHKPGLNDYLLGSTAARVVRHAPCAVHVCRTN